MTAHAAAGRFRELHIPGQNAPVSGIYRVHHGTGHRQDHDVVIIRGEELPACRLCKGDVQYVVKKQASYITDDFDFAAPPSLILPTEETSGTRRALKSA